MNNSVLGIDLGTSSVKILQRFADGRIVKSRSSYENISPNGWWEAICNALSELELSTVSAISLSSQVGTYIVNDKDVIPWNYGVGAEELKKLKEKYNGEIFLKEISMVHPNITSYPLPRLLYIKEHYPEIKSVCQPKDFICEKLTGNRVTDQYSWRGLINLENKEYSEFFLKEIGFEKEKLPEVIDYRELAGYTRKIAVSEKVLPENIPVFVGLNDYYASLLGMGIQNAGEMFDISGTSEHLGVLEEHIQKDTELVSGPYLKENVHYGVTASSGASIKFGLKLLEEQEICLEHMQEKNPPIFLPYLNGERAPIWDADAKGVFFGISEDCTKEELAYSTFEGVVFSLYHIYETMGKVPVKNMKISGGAAVFPVINQLKAEMFGIPAEILEENDTSALGAALVAAIGADWYQNFEEAVKEICKIKEIVMPTGYYKEWLEKRYSIYKELYPALKQQYERLKEIRK